MTFCVGQEEEEERSLIIDLKKHALRSRMEGSESGDGLVLLGPTSLWFTVNALGSLTPRKETEDK